MIICFDLDGTLCETNNGDYYNSKPIVNRILKVNKLYEEGNYIIIETARGSVSGINYFDLTKNQLYSWGIRYNELRTGIKKYADLYIDDKGIKDTDFFKKDI
jgi:CMP-N,N'-diacetyllegionaminic acid synthase